MLKKINRGITIIIKACVRGFTMIELLITISIMGLLLTLGLVYYQDFNRRQILNQAAKDLSSNLRLAQSRALAGEKPLDWCDGESETLVGYRLEFTTETEYQLMAVCSSSASEFQVTKMVKLPTNVVGPNGTGVLFKVLARGVEAETSFPLQGFGQEKRVTVELSGNIKIQ
jgi:prepilin-type N-terminal cleavage/methylation domain-containing protein